MAKFRNSFTKAEIEDALLGVIRNKPSSASDTLVEGTAKRVNVDGRNLNLEYSYEGRELRSSSEEVVITDLKVTGGGDTFLFSGAALSGLDFFVNIRRGNFERIESKVLVGDDVVIGSVIAETLTGFGGDDTLRGKGGDDRLVGGNGSDRLAGGGGEDVLLGGIGADTLIGGRGADLMRGNSGDDDLRGGAANDRLLGNGGSDRLRGDAGDDELLGGGKADVLTGGEGDDTLNGGGGADVFVFGSDDGSDVIIRYKAGVDSVDLSAVAEITDFSDLSANHLSDGDNGAEIAIDGDVLVRFDGVAVAALTEDDFIF